MVVPLHALGTDVKQNTVKKRQRLGFKGFGWSSLSRMEVEQCSLEVERHPSNADMPDNQKVEANLQVRD